MRTEPTGAVRAACLALSLGLLAACAEARHARADGDDSGQAPPEAAPARSAGDGVTAMPASVDQLAQSSWRLASGLPGVDAAGVEITLAFGAAAAGDDRNLPISGSGGCNGYHGSVHFGAHGTASVAPIAATKRGCAPPAGPAEGRWFDALSQLQSLHLQGERLQLVLRDGTRLQFDRR